jgi:hypothetical protein
VILIFGLTEDRAVGPYLRGSLLLNRIDLHTPLDQWLDAVYALWTTGPHEVLKKARQVVDQHSVTIAPDRDTWGLTPEQIAQMGEFAQLDDQQ